jgi:hypothetical protein
MSVRLSFARVAHINSNRRVYFLVRREASMRAIILRSFGLFSEPLIGARFGAHVGVMQPRLAFFSVFRKAMV